MTRIASDYGFTASVYIAGPYTKGDVAENVAKAMELWHELSDCGYAPFCPHLTHFLHIHEQRPYEEWLRYDLVWLRFCDALLRLPGDSSGADAEVEVAEKNGIPVFFDVQDLHAYFDNTGNQ